MRASYARRGSKGPTRARLALLMYARELSDALAARARELLTQSINARIIYTYLYICADYR